MKKLITSAGIVFIIIVSVLLIIQNSRNLKSASIDSEKGEFEKEKETAVDRQMAMWFQARAYPDPYYLNEKYERGWLQFQQLKNNAGLRISALIAANWTSLGPATSIGGRILCITITPSNSNILWAGSASGGLWKSTNAGSTWTPVITNLPLLGVSSIIVHPTDPNTIYAGTGEVYRVDTSNIGFNVWKARGTYGVGIIKSTDGGATWSQVLNKNTSDMYGIQMLEFDPTNSNTIYACATDGLYRSTDSGNNWSKILDKIYVTDVAIDPSNTNQIVAGVGNMVNADKGIYRTTNGNDPSPVWAKITSGLPASFNGFIRLDNVGSTRLVASIGRSNISTQQEIYLSTNFGSSWVAKNNSHHCQYQYWFSHDVAVNPSNLNQFIMGGVPLYRYTSSSTTSGSGTRTSIGSNVHSDIHDVEFDPNNSSIIYVACDGGIYKSTNGGTNFSNMNNGLAATQFYASFVTHPTDPNAMIGGLQDNGVVRYNGSTWTTVFGGDGGPCAISPNGNTVLASNDARKVRRSTTGISGSYSQVLSSYAFVADDRTGFMTPVAISKSNPNYMYVASDNMHISTNGGANWTYTSYTTATAYIEQQRKTGIALAVSPLNENKVYVSTSPFAQNTTNDYIWVNGQPNIFKTTTPSSVPYSSIKGLLPDRFVMDFAISPTNDDSIFIVLGGFGTSHVYVTGDGGASWTDIGVGLPDVPFNAILLDKNDPQVLYAGCDLGVYVSPDRGNTWVDYNNGFWDATLVMDLQMTADNQIVAATHGKGVFRSDPYNGGASRTITTFAGYQDNNINKLEWVSQQEAGLTRYELERSTDGEKFTRIASFSAGNRNRTEQYVYDDRVGIKSPAYYYRVKIINTGGSFNYTQVVKLYSGTEDWFSIAGNPFNGQVQMQATLISNKRINLSLYNRNGQLIRRQSFTGVQGINIFTMEELDGIPAGIYILEAVTDSRRQTWQLMKN
jgi:photosystem II stability/assembly factor-like uncharacterized protein